MPNTLHHYFHHISIRTINNTHKYYSTLNWERYHSKWLQHQKPLCYSSQCLLLLPQSHHHQLLHHHHHVQRIPSSWMHVLICWMAWRRWTLVNLFPHQITHAAAFLVIWLESKHVSVFALPSNSTSWIWLNSTSQSFLSTCSWISAGPRFLAATNADKLIPLNNFFLN